MCVCVCVCVCVLVLKAAVFRSSQNEHETDWDANPIDPCRAISRALTQYPGITNEEVARQSPLNESLSTLLESLDSSCHHMGLTINYKKTKLLAVLPGADTHPPAAISLHPDCDPIEVVPSFQYCMVIWFGNSSTSGATDMPVTEFCDEKPPLHPWSVPMQHRPCKTPCVQKTDLAKHHACKKPTLQNTARAKNRPCKTPCVQKTDLAKHRACRKPTLQNTARAKTDLAKNRYLTASCCQLNEQI